MIKPKDVYRLSWREITAINGEGKEEFEFLEDNVLLHLFSNYPQRRKKALRNLRDYLGNNTIVKKIERDGTIWAYLRVESKEQYILVGKYGKGPFFEPALQDSKLDMRNR
ncbi:MAG: ribonuclease III domain-containing protein [Nanoarchaeota archaeon]